MKITIVTGSRADWGPLEWPIKVLQEDSFFQGQILKVWGATFDQAFRSATDSFEAERPEMVLLLGDRFEILAVATAAHLLRIPIAHIGGGDVTQGSYDDAMRDAISRFASIHFVTSDSSLARLSKRGYSGLHLVGSPGVDYIMYADWKASRPIEGPYVVVSYQAETIDGTIDLVAVDEAVAERPAFWIEPNRDAGNDFRRGTNNSFGHAEFLNLLYHCEEFIGNSSAIYYEAPFLGIKTREIGKRQKGRVIPFGDGKASERIRDILKAWA